MVDKHTDIIYENILNNMQDGVISIHLDGKVMTFNDAAAKILNIAPETIMGNNFSSLFFKDPRNDDFSDIILKSIYDSSVTHQAVVRYYHKEKLKYLQLSTTFLFTEKKEKYGVIVVFTDVTQNFAMDRMKELFGKYIDPRIATRILEADKESEVVSTGEGHKQIMTVSFCDMQNFTGISDPLTPTELVNLVNAFFNKMSKPVHDYRGIIDKYIGDEIMSFWGQPFTEGNLHAELACNAALGQVRILSALNKELAGKVPPIYINIGIATGELIVGSVGSEHSKNFTAMGSTVSVASRLVGINKLYGTHILLTQATAESIQDEFEVRELDTVLAYVSQKIPLVIYELLGKKDKVAEELLQARDYYIEGLTFYRQRNWREAREALVQSLVARPFDRAAIVLMNRIEHYILHPPGHHWDGVWRSHNLI